MFKEVFHPGRKYPFNKPFLRQDAIIGLFFIVVSYFQHKYSTKKKKTKAVLHTTEMLYNLLK